MSQNLMPQVQVHRIVLMIVDHDVVGIEELSDIIENTKYPNHCMNPKVMNSDTREVRWYDQHPLNMKDEQKAGFNRIFDVCKT